jgi:hypothetical protein
VESSDKSGLASPAVYGVEKGTHAVTHVDDDRYPQIETGSTDFLARRHRGPNNRL